jgi:nucleoside-diphosphate-sugar epimerase
MGINTTGQLQLVITMRATRAKVLVTGGAGFIGSNLVEGLLQDGYAVTILDDLSTGRMENLSHLKGELAFHKGDVRDPHSVRRALEGNEAVFHLAAIASVERSVQDPSGVEETNVLGTLNILKASVECGIKRFIFPSSCAVYGDAKKLPIDEGVVPNPLSPYAVSKLAAESYCSVFQRVFGLETVSLRFFNVYGPRQTYNPYCGVIVKFLDKLLRREDLVVEGDGEQTRDFLNVKDAVAACILALRGVGATGEVFNIGSGRAISINELAKMMIEIAGYKARTTHSTARKGDIKYIYSDISKSKAILGFEPKVQLEQGLREIFELRSASQ